MGGRLFELILNIDFQDPQLFQSAIVVLLYTDGAMFLTISILYIEFVIINFLLECTWLGEMTKYSLPRGLQT